ncbi:MAG: formylglycine-generating enzyme family protein [Planctomycetes bacterium]|nr:formylglycine-generating enzyme family protein [Planctomycetota bacterium]
MLKGHNISNEQFFDNAVEFPSSVFCLGAQYDKLRDYIKAVDNEKNLGIGSVIHPTPAKWVTVPHFHMSRSMVTNQEYLDFLDAPVPEHIDAEEEYFVELPELWEHAWETARIGSVFYKMLTNDEVSVYSSTEKSWSEFYGDCENAIQAFIRSYKFEVYRLCKLPFKREGDGEERLSFSNDPLYTEKLVYDACEYVYKGFRIFFPAFYSDEEVEEVQTTIVERDGGFLNFRDNFIQYLDKLRGILMEFYTNNSDPKLCEQIVHNPSDIELYHMLARIRNEVSILETGQTLKIRSIFFPRFWKTRGDVSKKKAASIKGFKGLKKHSMKVAQVPWELKPLWGITLFEAIAYTSWLTQVIEDEYIVTLPSEGEYERAASWPQDGYEITPDFKMTVNIFDKSLFPWEPEHYEPVSAEDFRNPIKDFSAYFGNQSRSLEGFYFQDAVRYKKLLRDTARKVNDDPENRLETLVGFGWQWTKDRFNPNEIYFNRFQSQTPLSMQVYQETTNGDPEPADVYEFFAHGDNDQWSHFVCRGSGEILGGPGTTTRRIAMNPLRGFKQVGFRWIIQPQDIDEDESEEY